MNHLKMLAILACAVLGIAFGSVGARAAELRLVLPLGRTAYQTNEQIDLSVVRSAPQALDASILTLTATGTDGSGLQFAFPLKAVPVVDGQARMTDHLHLNGWLMRPGHYTVEVVAYGVSAKTEIDVLSHVRKSSFRLIDWGSRATSAQQAMLGEDGMGFNLLYAVGLGDNAIRGGLDFMGCCVQGGGHQLDLRMECDWSDPYVLAGGTARGARAAQQFRTHPNAIGVHLYDEPGLTWWKHAKTGEFTAHNVPAQDRAFKSAFGKDPLQYNEIDPKNPEQVAAWKQWATWKLGFMDAAWKDAQFGINYVNPNLLAVTQSQYGSTAFTDGYYFNVVRSLPITSGHGGYDDLNLGYFMPSMMLEHARARDFSKPCWYLPVWYSSTPSDRFRMEQYLSFMTGIQGMAKPPDIAIQNPAAALAADGVVESNKAMARLGTIFTTMPPARGSVALLYSLSNMIDAQAKDPKVMYAHGTPHMVTLNYAYLAGKMLQQQFTYVVDEDVVDGTVAANYKAVLLCAVSYLDPAVQYGLEHFIAEGGTVLMTPDCTVQVKGASVLAAGPDLTEYNALNAAYQAQDKALITKLDTVGTMLKGAMPLAKALKTALEQRGIAPVFVSDNPGIAASRQGTGEIEYLFAVNTTYDAGKGGKNDIKATTATIALPNDGRPVYDAMLGGAASAFKPQKQTLTGTFRFGAGQMRVFARTARPIGGVQLQTPLVTREYTAAQSPIRVQISALLVDRENRVLTGSAPLQIEVIDPLGVTRYALYRATEQGACKLILPLAANDPAGQWTVVVRELLANTSSKATFAFAAPGQCGALAGATQRAVIFGNDRDNIYRFFRTHKDVTVVVGTGAYNADAATRLLTVLKPLGVRGTVVKAAEVKSRILTEEEAATWIGLDFAKRGAIQPNAVNPPNLVGYDIPGSAILLGTPEDNVLIRFLQDRGFLPYKASADFPGRGRGYLAWQVDALAYQNFDSITAIAYDAEGMAEAVGSLYEVATGMEPLTPLELPVVNAVQPAKTTTMLPQAPIAWQVTLPDRAVAMEEGTDHRLLVTAMDGTQVKLDAAGTMTARAVVETLPKDAANAPVPDAVKKQLLPNRIAKRVAAGKDLIAVGYWGGTLQVLDVATGAVKAQQMLPQDITSLRWLDETLVVALADGRVLGLTVK